MKKTLLTFACGLLFSTGLFANGDCKQYMIAGTYLTTFSGWATLATTPIVVSAPTVGIGVSSIDENGTLNSITPLTVTTAGQTWQDTLVNSKMTVSTDCTVTFKANCPGGCSWEGAGYFVRNTNEIHLIFTKSSPPPVTATIVMKQVAK
jgi:hypothetical protein